MVTPGDGRGLSLPPLPHARPASEDRAAVEIGPTDRILVIAPHPDDESLGAGALIYRACQVGAHVSVLYLTDGENNPWAQRASERRLVISASDSARFGATRRAEALAALSHLGVRPDAVVRLGWPDQGVTTMLVERPASGVAALARIFRAFCPTLVVAPSRLDLHPDHSAAGVLTHLAQQVSPNAPRPRNLAYLIHHAERQDLLGAGPRLDVDSEAREAKRLAIRCHRSQAILRGPWLSSFAAASEPYLVEPGTPPTGRTIRKVESDGHTRVSFRCRPHVRAFGAATLFLVVQDPTRRIMAYQAPLSRGDHGLELFDPTGAPHGPLPWSGSARAGVLEITADVAPERSTVFGAVKRRFGFFDEAGWNLLSTGD